MLKKKISLKVLGNFNALDRSFEIKTKGTWFSTVTRVSPENKIKIGPILLEKMFMHDRQRRTQTQNNVTGVTHGNFQNNSICFRVLLRLYVVS